MRRGSERPVRGRPAALTALAALASAAAAVLLCGCGGGQAGSARAASAARGGRPESGRYWHVRLTVDTVSQDLWYDTEKGLIVRVSDDLNDFSDPQGVAGYKVTEGDFTRATTVTYTDRPPHVTYRFTTDALCTVKIAGSADRGTWGIVSKSDRYRAD